MAAKLIPHRRNSHHRGWILWYRCRSRIRWTAASVRVHDLQLCDAGAPFSLSLETLAQTAHAVSPQAIDQIVNSAGKTYYMSGG